MISGTPETNGSSNSHFFSSSNTQVPFLQPGNCSPDMLDPSESRNEGVVSDHLVRTSNGVQLRRIVYTKPEEGVIDPYLTNDFALVAANLKVFHTDRGKLCQGDLMNSLVQTANRAEGLQEKIPESSDARLDVIDKLSV